MASNYTPAHAGDPGIVDTTQRNPLNSIIKGDDGSSWIYLKGVASLAVKEAVTYDELGVTARLTANAVGPVAVAHSTAAPVSGEYGWFCIVSPLSGLAALSGGAVTDNKALYISSVTGTFDDAAVTGDLIVGAFARSTATGAGALTVQIDHPSVNDILG